MKKVGNYLYVHKSALNQLGKEIENYVLHKSKLIEVEYDVIKYNKKDKNISFIKVENWDKQKEPVLLYSVKITPDNIIKKRNENKKNPNIYHSKELFVNGDYKGFNIEEAKERTKQWRALKLDSKKIGRLQYWIKNITKHGLKI